MAMPSAPAPTSSAGGNTFVPTRVLVPVGIEDPVARFAAVHERLAAAKGERALGVVDGLAGFANLLPTSVLVRFARQQVETVDFTTSNVRGAPFHLYIAGARIEANYPLGPAGGHRLEPHADVLRRPARHGPPRRRGRGRRTPRCCATRWPRSSPR